MSDFTTYVGEQVKNITKNWSLKKEGQAFMMWYAMDALELEEIEAYEAVSYDGGNDKDIDLFYRDDQHEKIVIAQGKFNAKGEYKAKKGELLGLLHSTDWLSDIPALHALGRPDLVTAAEDLAEGLERGYTIHYQYVYMGPPNRDVTDQAELWNKNALDDFPGRQAAVVDLETLEAWHGEALGEHRRIPQASVKLLPGKFFSQEGTYGPAMIATLPAVELCHLYQQHGDKLFARNVRLFLGIYAGSVNAGLRDTLQSADRSNFWAYNNGVTVVCDSFTISTAEDSVELKNFSVVNGCQTTVSLTNAGWASEQAEVLVRFIAAPERLVDNVIFYTNSQTPVRSWELRGQDKRQKRIQSEMAAGALPWYYALRRGEARALSAPERAKYTRDGKFHGIGHDVLGQYLAAFRGLPYVAYKDKGKIFSIFYDSVFPADLTVEEALLAWRPGEASDRVVGATLKKAIESGDELDALILKRGGRLFTAAVMAQVLQQRNGGTYLNNLKREVVTSKKTMERLAVYAQVACVWYVRATRQMVGSGGQQQLSSLLRTQDSYPQLRKAIDEEWSVQSIDKSWVQSLPMLV